jgi:hypothetical protein
LRALDEDVAEAKRMPILLLGMTFMLLVAVARSIAVQVVGVLLMTAEMSYLWHGCFSGVNEIIAIEGKSL